MKAHKVEIVQISSLKPHPRNYRLHPDDQLTHLVESLRKFGVYRNVVVARDSTILAGHGVVQAAKKAKLAKIPVIRLDVDPQSPSAMKVLVGDNEIEHLAEQNDRLLSDILKEIKDTEADGLLGTGFDEKMLAAFAMVTRHENEIKDFDAAAHWVGMPEFTSGERAFVLAINFESESKREVFAKKIRLTEAHIRKQNKVWTCWWPPKTRKKRTHHMRQKAK